VPTLLSVAEAARRLGCRPRDVSDAFYQGRLPDDLSQVVAGRRVISEPNLPLIAELLQRSCGLAAIETRTMETVLNQSTPLAEVIDAV